MPGSTPATSQLDWLISTTAITVLSWSRATRDLLKSFGWGIRALHQLDAATMVPSPRRLPHTISPVEGAGFELSVPLYGELGAFGRVRRDPRRHREAQNGRSFRVDALGERCGTPGDGQSRTRDRLRRLRASGGVPV